MRRLELGLCARLGRLPAEIETLTLAEFMDLLAYFSLSDKE